MENYNPIKNGAIQAIRIFYSNNTLRTPMAELVFAFGGTTIIHWNRVDEREKYIKGINGYTLIYDEREKAPFKDFIKK